MLCNKGTISYAEILKKVRTDPQLVSVADKVTHIRRTAKSELVFHLKKRGG